MEMAMQVQHRAWDAPLRWFRSMVSGPMWGSATALLHESLFGGARGRV